MTAITPQTIGRREFLRTVGLGVVALGTVATTAQAEGDGKPALTPKQRQIEFERLRRAGVPETELRRKAEAHSKDLARRVVALEMEDYENEKTRSIVIPIIAGGTLMVASAVTTVVLEDLLCNSKKPSQASNNLPSEYQI